MRFVWVALFILTAPQWAAAAEMKTNSNVQSVTVFLSGAEIARQAKVNLSAGEHTLIIDDLPASAITASIRVEGTATGKLDIVSVDTNRKYVLRSGSVSAGSERQRLEDEIERLSDERSIMQERVTAAQAQAQLIQNLATLPQRPAPAAGANGVAEDWSSILTTISDASRKMAEERSEAKQKLRELDKQLKDLRNKLSELAPERTRQTEVRVNVIAEAPLEADISVRYQVANAKWQPLYDARLSTGSKTQQPQLVVARRASISQATGEKWTDVDLKLSTSRPYDGASAPDLRTLTVDFEKPIQPEPIAERPQAVTQDLALEESDGVRNRRAYGGRAAGALSKLREAPAPAPVIEQQADVISAPFEATYDVPGRTTIKDNGQAKSVVLLNNEFNPKLTTRSVPRVDNNAYLYAGFTLEKGTPLLPGKVYQFRDGTFVGSGRMPLVASGIEHQLGFGIDDHVKIRHSVLEEKSGETGLISTSRVDSRNYEVSVKNLHERPIAVEIQDRRPISKNEEIKVDYVGRLAPSVEDIDGKRGVFAFHFDLEADEEKVLQYGYKVTWPSAKTIDYGP